MKQSASKRHTKARRQRPLPIAWPKKQKRRILPAWIPVVVVIGLCTMLVLTINFRAFSELEKESAQFEELNGKIQQATSENLSLQEEIYYLKNDPTTVQREAKKFGFAAPGGDRVPVTEPKADVLTVPKEKAKPVEKEVKPKNTEIPMERGRVIKKSESTPTKKEKVSRVGEPDKAEKSANRQLPTRK